MRAAGRLVSRRPVSFERLRQLLASPYFSPGADLRSIDVLAAARRYEGLAAWRDGLERLAAEVEGDEGRRWRRKGVSARRLREDGPKILDFFQHVSVLAGARPERDWIDLTLEILDGKTVEKKIVLGTRLLPRLMAEIVKGL